ncbi:hypothetical protein COCON_G00091310 [Conger conger]|uniref:Uncharacterized protein n=1 Tax=Conger conger TaxID=82655 RepID=A0A9Q1I064_CONCO|nr:hypothetical protein COCON_G00091310 [Conger conger]
MRCKLKPGRAADVLEDCTESSHLTEETAPRGCCTHSRQRTVELHTILVRVTFRLWGPFWRLRLPGCYLPDAGGGGRVRSGSCRAPPAFSTALHSERVLLQTRSQRAGGEEEEEDFQHKLAPDGSRAFLSDCGHHHKRP